MHDTYAEGAGYSGADGIGCSSTKEVATTQFIDNGRGAPFSSTSLTKRKLASEFEMKNLGLMYCFMGLEV